MIFQFQLIFSSLHAMRWNWLGWFLCLFLINFIPEAHGKLSNQVIASQILPSVDSVILHSISHYDANNRLTQMEDNLGSDDSQTITYTYDNNGNRLTKTDAIAETPETSAFAYNSLNQLVQVIRGSPGSGDVVGLYDYDYAGMRIRQLNSDRGDIQVIYDGQSILEERDSSNGLLAHYRYGDRLVSLKTSSDEHYYHYSGLNTTANLTNGSGGIQASYRTDIWGNITQESGSSPNRQIFTGHQTDQNTGLIYMKARHYDPDVGGFLTQDSYLGELNTPPSLHRYLYVYGNPTVYVDPTGHFAVLEGMTDRLGEMRQEIINDAAESNLLMAGVKGLGAGLVGVLEVGVGALNLAGDLAVNAVADEGSDSFFVQDSRRSLGETKQSFSQVATAVKENPLGVAKSIGRGIVDTASGIAQGDACSVAQGAAFGFEALTGGGLAKSTASSTKSAAKTVTSKMKESQRVQSASLTVETTVAAGGNQLRALGTSAVNGARAAAKTAAEKSSQAAGNLAKNAMKPGPSGLKRQLGAIGDVDKIKLGGDVKDAKTHFPDNPNDLTKALGVDPKVSTTQHGTTRMTWSPNSNTRIRYESHPGDSGPFNARHHGEHYHVEIKPSNLSWGQAKRRSEIQKVKPENYQPGYGTGFLPGEGHPGM